MQSPNWKHDCEECELLGSFKSSNGVIDVWFHQHEIEMESTLILRLSDDGADYRSFPLKVVRGLNSITWVMAYSMYRSAKGV